MGEAHDVHSIQCFLEIVLVLLARDGNVTIWQETIAVKSFEEKIRWRRKVRWSKSWTKATVGAEYWLLTCTVAARSECSKSWLSEGPNLVKMCHINKFAVDHGAYEYCLQNEKNRLIANELWLQWGMCYIWISFQVRTIQSRLSDRECISEGIQSTFKSIILQEKYAISDA